MNDIKQMQLTGDVMEVLQNEYQLNRNFHLMQRTRNLDGIRSSQISALIAVLIKLNIIKEEDLEKL